MIADSGANLLMAKHSNQEGVNFLNLKKSGIIVLINTYKGERTVPENTIGKNGARLEDNPVEKLFENEEMLEEVKKRGYDVESLKNIGEDIGTASRMPKLSPEMIEKIKNNDEFMSDMNLLAEKMMPEYFSVIGEYGHNVGFDNPKARRGLGKIHDMFEGMLESDEFKELLVKHADTLKPETPSLQNDVAMSKLKGVFGDDSNEIKPEDPTLQQNNVAMSKINGIFGDDPNESSPRLTEDLPKRSKLKI